MGEGWHYGCERSFEERSIRKRDGSKVGSDQKAAVGGDGVRQLHFGQKREHVRPVFSFSDYSGLTRLPADSENSMLIPTIQYDHQTERHASLSLDDSPSLHTLITQIYINSEQI